MCEIIEGVRAKKCTYPRVKPNMYLITEDGRVYSLTYNRFLIPQQASGGYLSINLCSTINKDGTYHGISVSIHRLVAWEFIPNPNSYPEVDHLNGNKQDNHVSNLEWVTGLENTRRALRNGLSNKKYMTDEEAIEICELLEKGYGSIDILRILTNNDFAEVADYPALYENIRRLRYREGFEYITKNYTYTLESTKRKGRLSNKISANAVYSVEVIHKICELLSKGLKPIEVYEYFCHSTNTHDDRKLYHLITDIRERVRWTYISKDYYWDMSKVAKPIPLEENEFYKHFVEGLSLSEVKRMYLTSDKHTNKKVSKRIKRTYDRFIQIKEIPNGTVINIIE